MLSCFLWRRKSKMPSSISINFHDNPENIYFTGQTVSGTVEMKFEKVKRVQAISLQICGFAKTQWTSKNKQIEKQTSCQYSYSGRENYISSKKYLLGSDHDSPRNIEPESYSFDFSCILPKQLPSSFEGSMGHIRYVAKVTFERPWKFDQTYTVGFTVLRPLDLNLESPLLRIPSEVEVFHEFWCSLCKSKPIHIKGKLPQTGFVPGQVIPLQAEINNASNVDVKQVQITLQCVVSYQADTPSLNCQQETVDLVCKKCGPVLKNTIECFKQKLVVPPVPSSSNSSVSKTIQIAYCIRIEAVTAFVHKNAFVLFPITVGTVPFIPGREQVESQEGIGLSNAENSSPVSIKYLNTFPLLTPIRDLQLLTVFDLDPPSYAETVNTRRVQVDEEETYPIHRTDFAPKYPYYNFEIDLNKN